MKSPVCLLLPVACAALTVASAATFPVTNTNTSGAGTLAQAITDANGAAGADVITFNIGGGGLQTITSALLPVITDTVLVDGTTQPGFAGTPLIDLNGNFQNFPGLVVNAPNCVIRALLLRNYGRSSSATQPGHGIWLQGAGGNTVERCWLGITSDGSATARNKGFGVFIDNCPNNTIGGPNAAQRNVISGASSMTIAGITSGASGVGVVGAAATGNVIAGNYIGTDPQGAADRGSSQDGILISGAPGNTIGGTGAGAGNVIAGNSSTGVRITGAGAVNNQILGNIIGLNAAGTAKLSNDASGVRVEDVGPVIIGAAAGARNVISGSSGFGIVMTGANADGCTVAGNFIGTDITGTADLGNGSTGLLLIAGAGGNMIGGTAAGAGNVISGNGNVAGSIANGIRIQDTGSTGNTVQGNRIGVAANGTAALGNSDDGIAISNAPGNTIGGTAAGAGNVIGANGNFAGVVKTGSGISLALAGTTGNVIQGNFIGTDVTGTLDLGNARSGVHIRTDSLTSQTATGNTIGGTAAGARNVIAFNDGSGITLQAKNILLGNRVYSNDTLQIDAIRADSEGDITEPRPVITSAVNNGANIRVAVTFTGEPNTLYTIEVFDPPENGENMLESVGLTTAQSGVAGSLTQTFDVAPVQPGNYLIAMVTQTTTGADYEASAGYQVTDGNPAIATSAQNFNFTVFNDPVNTRNGELLAQEAVDIDLGGPLPVFFTRYYASLLTAAGKVTSALGRNRSHPYDTKLTLTDATHAEVILANGCVLPFEKTGGLWSQRGREDMPCQLLESAGGFRFAVTAEAVQYVFATNGKLARIEDGRGNALTVTQGTDGPASVSDGLGRTLTFSYTTGRLTGLSDGTRNVAFGYDGNGNLTSAADVQGRTTTYAYDAAGNLTGVTKPAGNTPVTQTFAGGKVTGQTIRGAVWQLAWQPFDITGIPQME